MSIVIDTHFVILLADDRLDLCPRAHRDAIKNGSSQIFVSVVSLWEVAIKARLGKLPIRNPAENWPGILESGGVIILPMGVDHVFAPIGPAPTTKDPFDRLLLGVCAAEGMKLLTIDRDLVDHPLAWREG